MSALLDQLLTKEQRASCAIHDTPVDWVQPAEACTEVGADEIRAESARDPWLWRLIPGAIAAGAILTAWFEVAA